MSNGGGGSASLDPRLPNINFAATVACVAGTAALANCTVIAALTRRSTHGLMSIILQLAIADLVLLFTTALPELWSCNSKTWHFGEGGCLAYRGLSVFASTASLYLIVTIALHSIATFNLEENLGARSSKRNDLDDDEIRSSRHSLVANSDSSTPPRTMNIDYRLPVATRVPVRTPAVFVWTLSASLSVPMFLIATTVSIDGGAVLCTLAESVDRLNMQMTLTGFHLIVPALIMSYAIIIICLKLKKRKVVSRNSTEALKLSLCLIGNNIILCFPRSIFNIYNLSHHNVTFIDLAENNSSTITLTCIYAYMVALLLRPVCCFTVLSRLRKLFSFGFRHMDLDSV